MRETFLPLSVSQPSSIHYQTVISACTSLSSIHSSILLNSSSASLLLNSCPTKVPKPPNYQTQWAPCGVLMWPLSSISTLGAPLSATVFFSQDSLLILLFIQTLHKLFFEQLLDSPCRRPAPRTVAPRWYALLTVALFHPHVDGFFAASAPARQTSVLSQHPPSASHMRFIFICTHFHAPASPPRLC